MFIFGQTCEPLNVKCKEKHKMFRKIANHLNVDLISFMCLRARISAQSTLGSTLTTSSSDAACGY